MYSFLSHVETILDQNAIYHKEYIEPDHITICTDKMMKDPGFAYDNKLLDVFIDQDHRILFIGLLRLPAAYRRKHIGFEIVKNLLDWAKENGYTTFLDSCDDSTPFWRHCGFDPIEYQDGFYVMGCGERCREKWKQYGRRLLEELH